MSGLVDLLNIAKTALQTQQLALTVTGHNIANASTPGYTRQELGITEAVPFITPQGDVGRGVAETGVTAERDTFLDALYRAQSGNASNANSTSTLLTQVQTLFNEPTANGLGTALDDMFGGFADLANDPANGATRIAVQQDAVQVVNQLHTLAQGIAGVVQSATAQFNSTVDQINQIVSQVAQLNTQIVAQGGPNHSAPDLADQRGVLLDQLGGLANMQLVDNTNGSVGVVVGDTMLVDGGQSQQVQTVTKSDGTLGVGVVGDTRIISVSSGTLAGLSNVLNTAVPAIQGQLDQLTAGLVNTVNTIHESGTNSSNVTGTDFFNPAGVTAATIALAPGIAASPSNIVTGATSAAGDNSVALQLAALHTTPVAALGNSSIGSYYTTLVTGLGSMVNNAQQAATASQTVASGLQAQRASETGVSTNDEMIALITQQSAFAAASKIVSVADELMQTVLAMVQ